MCVYEQIIKVTVAFISRLKCKSFCDSWTHTNVREKIFMFLVIVNFSIKCGGKSGIVLLENDLLEVRISYVDSSEGIFSIQI